MPRSLGWSFLLSAATIVVTACGARTGDDELLGSDGSLGVGGLDVVGGTSSGGSSGSGGWVATGATGGTGGWIGTGGVSTGGWAGSGGWIGTGGASTGGWAGSGGWIGTGGVIGVGGFGGLPNDCCSVANTPGCFNPFVTSCVCSTDSFCCDTAWDGWCVEEVETLGCGVCDPGTGGTGGISSGGTGGWISTGGVGAGGVGGSGATGGVAGAGGIGGSTGSCCGTHWTTGCEEPAVEACVCAFDPYCCTDHWDGLCVSEVTSEGCGMCGGGTGGIGGTGGMGGTGGIIGTGGVSTGGVAGAGGAIGGSGGMGTGGVGQCQAVFTDACGSCLCGGCYSSMQGCFADPQCWAVLGCLDSPDVCQALIDLVGGWNAPSVVKALQLLSCAGNSGCPCN